MIKSSGHHGAGLRLSSALWDGLDDKATRQQITQAYWNAATKCLVLALPYQITGKETTYRNDLGAVMEYLS